MTWPTIEKPKQQGKVTPNLLDYQQVVSTFSWDSARVALDSGLADGRGLNIADQKRFTIATPLALAVIIWRCVG